MKLLALDQAKNIKTTKPNLFAREQVYFFGIRNMKKSSRKTVKTVLN